MDCETCAERRKQSEPVPYVVHESDMARLERTIKKLWVLAVILIVLLFGTNAAWIYYESQFETVEVTQEVEQDTDNGGINTFVGGDYFGSTESKDKGTDKGS